MKPKNESNKNEFSQSLDDEKDDKFLDEIDSVIDEARVLVDFKLWKFDMNSDFIKQYHHTHTSSPTESHR